MYYKQEKKIKAYFASVIPTLLPELEKWFEIQSDIDTTTRVVFTGSVAQYKMIERSVQRYKPLLVNYVWDLYEWAWQGKRENDYDWRGYGEFVKTSDVIICPNEGTRLRINGYLDKDAYVIPAHVDYYEYSRLPSGYVLDHMREYPTKEAKWAEKACKELNIPYKRTNHQLSEAEFRDAVSNAALLVTPYAEASTGGLTLLEGLYNGVPSLVADGEYSGGLEYLGEFANTFKAGDYNDFKKQLGKCYKEPPAVDTSDSREFIKTTYSKRVIAQSYYDHVCFTLQRVGK